MLGRFPGFCGADVLAGSKSSGNANRRASEGPPLGRTRQAAGKVDNSGEDRGNHPFSEEIRLGKIYSFKLKYFFNGGIKTDRLSLSYEPPFPNGAAVHFESITLVTPFRGKKVNMKLNVLKPRDMSRVIISILPLLVVSTLPLSARQPDFGPNVTVFDPSMPAATIQNAVNAISQTQVPTSAQFNTVRHAFLFKPGAYTVDVQVGYYTTVAGLGLSPDDVTINGIVHSEGAGNSTLINFWRSAENMHIVPQSGQTERWAVSQASPFRRMHVTSSSLFWIMPLDASFSSGGFIADSWFEDEVLSGSQQQWLTRNSILGNGWTNGVWNQVFSGVIGAPAQNFPPNSANPIPTRRWRRVR